MSSLNQDLQKYLGKNVRETSKELENSGYEVHLVRIGSCATGFVPQRVLKFGEDTPKRVIISYNGDDPEEKITSIREDKQ